LLKKTAAEASCHVVCKCQNNFENTQNKGKTAIATTKKVGFKNIIFQLK
jgi:hypothetical protein